MVDLSPYVHLVKCKIMSKYFGYLLLIILVEIRRVVGDFQ